MAQQRFFLKNIDPQAGIIDFPPDIAHQIEHVLRLQPGDKVLVLDGGGKAYQAALNRFESDRVTAEILSAGEAPVSLPAAITLFFPLSRREKVEWIIQKGTEVGVSVFCPFVSARSLVQETELSSKRARRWEAIIREAAEQSGRSALPVLQPPQKISDILSARVVPEALDALLLAAVDEKQQTISGTLRKIELDKQTPSIGLFIGAEGGFSEAELSAFAHARIPAVSLGKTILRMETAAIVFPALVLDYFNRQGSF